MTATNTFAQLKTPKGAIFGLGISLIVLHLTYLWLGDESEILGTSILLWMAVGSLIWDKRDDLELDSNAISTLLGIAAIAFVLLRSFSPAGYHLRVSPFLSLLGLCLLASRATKLHHYWRELVILSTLGFGSILRLGLQSIDLPLITAKFSSFLLWYGGVEVQRRDLFIFVPGGRVEVYGACSGMNSIIEMTTIAVLFVLLFETTKFQKVLTFAIAPTIGFVVNGIRVCLLTLLVGADNTEAFDYWHGGDGSLVFFAISVLAFWGIAWLVFLREPGSRSPQFEFEEEFVEDEEEEDERAS